MNILSRRATSYVAALLLALVLAGCEGQAPVAPPAPSSGSGSGQSGSVSVGKADDATVWPSPLSAGQKVELAPNPLAKVYYFILDGSGSMEDKACGAEERKIVIARRAFKELMGVLPSDIHTGYAAFDSRLGTSERVPIGVGSKHRELVLRAVDETIAGGGTPLHNAVILGYQKLEEQARKQLGYGEYHLVLVTDGEANAGQDPTKVVNFILSHSPVVVHTVGFCIGSDHSLNQKGRTDYKEASDYHSLKQGLEEVTAESLVFDAKFFQK